MSVDMSDTRRARDPSIEHVEHVEHSEPNATLPPLIVVLRDGERVGIARRVARASAFLSEALDACCGELPLEDISATTLSDVLAFCEHEQSADAATCAPMPLLSEPLRTSRLADCVPEWYARFVEGLSHERLYALALAADFLDIPGLHTLCCARFATEIMGKSPAEIRAHFGIANDFSPEEEAAVKQENRWCEDA